MMVETRDFEEAARNNPPKADLASISWGVGRSAGQESMSLGVTDRRALLLCCADQTAPARNGNLCPSLTALICAIPNLLIPHLQL